MGLLDGDLDYDAYCLGIDTTVAFLQRFIASKRTRTLQDQDPVTGRILFPTYSGNGYKPFIYDFVDTGGEDDLTKQL